MLGLRYLLPQKTVSFSPHNHQLAVKRSVLPVRYLYASHQSCPVDAIGEISVVARECLIWTTLHLIARATRLGTNYELSGICSVMVLRNPREGEPAPPWRLVREFRLVQRRVIVITQYFLMVTDSLLNMNEYHHFQNCDFLGCVHQ